MIWVARTYRASDAPMLREVFYSAVHLSAAAHYTLEQRRAWAPEDYDAEQWAELLHRWEPFVVVDGVTPVGFADVQRDGAIELFYVAGTHARRGIGTALMQTIHARASEWQLDTLHSRVSDAARPLFEKWGFEVIENRMPIVRGVAMPNSLMLKSL